MRSKIRELVKERASRHSTELMRLAKVPLRLTPLWVEAIGAGAFISTVVEKHPRFRARLAELEDKAFLFEAKDIGKRFYLHVKGGEIRVVPHMAKEPDVVMRGEVEVLVSLLLGKVDPDTVFFSRKLEINGDTSAAILFKNLLASL